MPARFDEIEIGQVVSLGAVKIDAEILAAFAAGFAPGWDLERGAPDAMIYAPCAGCATRPPARWCAGE